MRPDRSAEVPHRPTSPAPERPPASGRLGRPPASGRLVLRGGVLGDGSRADVALDPGSGRIAEVGTDVAPLPGDVVERCDGMVVLPAPAEPHTHLDKALASDSPGCDNPDGDLAGAISVWHAHWASLRHDDLVGRATRAVEGMVLRGTTAIRSHVDVGDGLGLTAVSALAEVRSNVTQRGLVDLQLVALMASPVTGAEGAPGRRLLEEALDLGVDVVGGCPYRDPDPQGAASYFLEVAQRRGVAVDLHTDETLDAEVLTVADLARLVAQRGPGAGVTASHCVSLGMTDVAQQKEIAMALAAAGVSVVALPQTNLYLQARGVATGAPRGLTALRPLLDAGVVVAGGADNVRDPFCSMGRLDATETAGGVDGVQCRRPPGHGGGGRSDRLGGAGRTALHRRGQPAFGGGRRQ
jgi:cytosine deaminase